MNWICLIKGDSTTTTPNQTNFTGYNLDGRGFILSQCVPESGFWRLWYQPPLNLDSRPSIQSIVIGRYTISLPINGTSVYDHPLIIPFSWSVTEPNCDAGENIKCILLTTSTTTASACLL